MKFTSLLSYAFALALAGCNFAPTARNSNAGLYADQEGAMADNDFVSADPDRENKILSLLANPETQLMTPNEQDKWWEQQKNPQPSHEFSALCDAAIQHVSGAGPKNKSRAAVSIFLKQGDHLSEAGNYYHFRSLETMPDTAIGREEWVQNVAATLISADTCDQYYRAHKHEFK